MFLCNQEHAVELHMFSPVEDDSILEILYSAASYHYHDATLGSPHTLNFGRTWTPHSLCTHGVIQQPFIDGPTLEIFDSKEFHAHCYWLLPITEQEKDFAVSQGFDALAEIFETNGLDYLDPNRASLV